ncbi:MAG: biotin--[acetyl-CoA-carboxylase] ligase [Desulfuromonadales bacterium]|nr:biotin--[acetyl-CoA-carboxylase] ligase [Desulfuromonadales bacterium]
MTSSGTREKILGLFRQAADGFVSGAAISRELGVSRSAVWKQIEALRQLGYQIDAVPSRGYRLLASPDALLPEELQTGLETALIGRRLHCFSSLESTNLQAFALGEQEAEEGTVVIAEQQTAGKGRMGRRWESPIAVNLYASVLLRPQIPPWDAPQLTFLSAVAVCRAIQDTSGLKATVKWPNDILVNGRKVAGLLNEMSSETDRITFVVLGIGVNLNMTREQFPAELRYPATSLAIESGRTIVRVDFTRALLHHLDSLYATCREYGFGPVLAAWAELSELVGRQVVVDCQSRLFRGRVTGFGADGALLLEKADGGTERILAGDVLVGTE